MNFETLEKLVRVAEKSSRIITTLLETQSELLHNLDTSHIMGRIKTSSQIKRLEEEKLFEYLKLLLEFLISIKIVNGVDIDTDNIVRHLDTILPQLGHHGELVQTSEILRESHGEYFNTWYAQGKEFISGKVSGVFVDGIEGKRDFANICDSLVIALGQERTESCSKEQALKLVQFITSSLSKTIFTEIMMHSFGKFITSKLFELSAGSKEIIPLHRVNVNRRISTKFNRPAFFGLISSKDGTRKIVVVSFYETPCIQYFNYK